MSNEFRNSDLPYVDNMRDLVKLKKEGKHSHVRVHEKLFVMASRKPSALTPLDQIEQINQEFGLTIGLLEYDSTSCASCGREVTGYDFMKGAVGAHGARFLSNEHMYGFLLRVSDDPLLIDCPGCATPVAAGNYIDHHQHGATHTCFAYGCSRSTEDLEAILETMASGARSFRKRVERETA